MSVKYRKRLKTHNLQFCKYNDLIAVIYPTYK